MTSSISELRPPGLRDAAGEARLVDLLAAAGGVLSASLNAPETARAVLGLVVPRVADWAVIDLVHEDGDLSMVELRASDAFTEARLRALYERRGRSPCEGLPQGRPPTGCGIAELFAVVDDQAYAAVATDEEEIAALRELAPHSVIVVPMEARGHCVGMLTLFRATTPAPFHQDDLLLAVELGRRAAMAIDNALLFEGMSEARARAEQASALMARREEMIAALAAAATPQQVAAVVLQYGRSALDADTALVALLTPESGQIDLLRAIGLPEELRAGWASIIDELPNPFTDAIVRRRAVIVAPDDWERLYPQLEAAGIARGTLAVGPLLHGERVVGVVAFGCDAGREMALEPAAFVGECSVKCAMAFERAQLFRREEAAHASAETAIRSRDDLLGVVAHDLRNPVGSIAMYASLLLDSGTTEQQRAKYATAIISSTRQIDGLIQDLVDAARVEAGQLRVDPEPLVPRHIVSESLEAIEGIALEKGVALEALVPDDAPRVVADRHRLLQVLSNLLGNAVKFTPRGGRIELRVEPLGSDVLFLVTDTGPGIPRDNLPHLFDRFWQARNASRSGAGLGLAIAKGIVEAHHGRIGVESAPGKGSTFFFTLPTPLSDSPPASAPVAEPPLALGETTHPQLRVILTDDHPTLLRGIAEHLRRAEGIEVVAELTTGEAAVEETRRLHPDVVVMDLTMPGMGGLEAIRRIRALDPRVKLLALTAETEAEALIEVLEAGGHGLVRKSTAHEDLLPALRTVARDEVYLYPDGQRLLLRAYHAQPARNEALLEPLSEHEREILALAAEGYTSAEIGKRLFLSPKTVDTYRAQAMRKVGLTHRTQLVRFALKTGLLRAVQSSRAVPPARS